MLIKLRRADVSYYEGYGLRGFLQVEDDTGQSRMYSFRLPTPEETDPPGWQTIEKLTQVTSTDVAASWDDLRLSNPVAEQAALELSSRYGGSRFVIREDRHADGSTTVELVPLDPTIAAPKKLDVENQQAPIELPPTYVTAFQIDLEQDPGSPAYVVVKINDLSEGSWPRFRAPDAQDRTPDDWWFIETFTGVAHERVATSWKTDDRGRSTNAPLTDAVQLLAAVLSEHNSIPLSANNQGVDIARWRRELVQFRFARRKKPFVFLGRPDHNVDHTRAIIYDVAGAALFVANAEPGKSPGTPALIGDERGKTTLKILDNEVMMRGILNRHIRFARAGRPPKGCNPPRELIHDLISFPDRTWPVVRGVVRIPTVREDGSIITRPGYDPSTQLWFAPEFELEPVPENPTNDDVQRARALILTPIAEFPFVDDGARAAAVASLLEQIVRPMIRGPRPLYIFDAPEQGQGSGKTLLAKVFQGVITGTEPSISALGKKEDEIEKRLTTLLRQGEPFVILDNLTREVTSEALQQLATSERWQARLLNTNDAPIYPQNATWVLTLNGAKMNRDIARRVVLARLDTKMAIAYKRTGWKIDDVVTWARERRAAIIRACLILTRAWVRAGRPKDPTVVRGSFEAWCAVIGGILKHSGFEGLSTALDVTADRDVHAEEHRMLVRAWLAEYPIDQPIPAITLGLLAQRHGLYDDRLPKKGSNYGVGKAMASILKSGLVGNVIDGFRIGISPTTLNGYTTYTIAVETPTIDSSTAALPN